MSWSSFQISSRRKKGRCIQQPIKGISTRGPNPEQREQRPSRVIYILQHSITLELLPKQISLVCNEVYWQKSLERYIYILAGTVIPKTLLSSSHTLSDFSSHYISTYTHLWTCSLLGVTRLDGVYFTISNLKVCHFTRKFLLGAFWSA